MKLTKIRVSGFRSIREAELELRPINVLIGANGSGKSNVLSLFAMLSHLAAAPDGKLGWFVGQQGGASSILHRGPKHTDVVALEVGGTNEVESWTYRCKLQFAARDRLVFAEETTSAGRAHGASRSLGGGETESRLFDELARGTSPATQILQAFRGCRTYHFHDTSMEAEIRRLAYVEKSNYLRPDGGNLAPFLAAMRRDSPKYYERVIRTIQQVAPFFGDFELEASGENGSGMLLNWRDQDPESLFGPHQLSDGTLRAMALISLLLQPESDLPSILVLDEPELGLHPYAISVIAALLRQASHDVQVVVATQSPQFVDHFLVDEIVVSTLRDGTTTLERLDEHELREWLSEYSLGELWQKNVLGGTPRR